MKCTGDIRMTPNNNNNSRFNIAHYAIVIRCPLYTHGEAIKWPL